MKRGALSLVRALGLPVRAMLWLLTAPARWSTRPAPIRSSARRTFPIGDGTPEALELVQRLSAEFSRSAPTRRRSSRTRLARTIGLMAALVLGLILALGAFGYFESRGTGGGTGVAGSFTGPVDHFLLTPSSGTETAGAPFSLTVTAEDSSGHAVTGYTGTVSFTSSDPDAVLPSSYTFTTGVGDDDGQHTFTGVTLNTVGDPETVTVSDGAKTGEASFDVVAPGPASQIVLTGDTNDLQSGASRTFTATIEDAAGHTETIGSDSSDRIAFVNAGGTGTITTTPGSGVVKASNGVATVTVTGDLVGSVRLVASTTFSGAGSVTDSNQVDFNVVPGSASQIVLSGDTSNLTAGTTRTFTATIEDANGNTVTSGPDSQDAVAFTQKSGSGTVSGLASPDAVNGVASDTLTGQEAGAVNLVATATLSGPGATSSTPLLRFTVVAGTATQVVLSGSTTNLTAGANRTFTATIEDAEDNPVTTDSTDTVVFSQANAGAAGAGTVTGLSSPTASSGEATDTITGGLAGTVTLQAAVAGLPGSNELTFTVKVGAASRIVLSGSATDLGSGTTRTFTATVEDAGGNTISTDGAGKTSITFTQVGGGGSVSGLTTVTASGGIATDPVTGDLAGSVTLEASGTLSGLVTSNDITFNVVAGPLDHFAVSAPSNATAGTPFGVSVTAEDAAGNTVTGYTGTVHFTSSDTGAGVVLPADYTFTSAQNGSHTFTGGVTLATASSETVSVVDTSTPSIAGTSNPIAVAKASPALSVSVSVSGTGTVGVGVLASSVSANLSSGYHETGSIAFTVFGPSATPPGSGSCSSGGTSLGTAVPVSGNGFYHPGSGFTPASAGDYWLYASYSGDGNNAGAASACPPTAEIVVGQATPILSVSGPGTGTVGTAIAASSISASLSSGYNPTGSISFTVFGPSAMPPGSGSCSSGGTSLGSALVSGNGSYQAGMGFTPSSAGDYWLYARYGGDGNNATATSACPPTAEIVVSPPPLSDLKAVVGAWGCHTCAWIAGDNGTILYGNGTSFSAQVSGVTADLNGVSAPYSDDDEHVWAVGDNGTILECTSNCTTSSAVWVEQQSNTTADLYAVGGARDGGNDVWAVGAGGVVDLWNGSTWTPQTASAADLFGTGTYQRGSTTWIVGAHGTILESIDGVTWNTQNAPTIGGSDTYTLRSVSSYDSSDENVWAVGDNGIVIYTTNGGVAWSQASTSDSTTNSFYGVAASAGSASTSWPVFAVGAQGGIYISTNGTSFAKQTSGTTKDLYGVNWNTNTGGSGPSDAWAVGQQGTILYTSNAGATWTAGSYPAIISLSPTSGPPGTSGVSVSGGGFAASHSVTITFNGATPSTESCGDTTATGALPASCTFTVPASVSCVTCPVIVSDGTNQAVGYFSVDTAPTITSGSSGFFTTNVANSFTVTTSGFPTPSIGNGFAGCIPSTLPGTITLQDNGNGTAVISGTPTAPGTYTLCLDASNGISPDATQKFTLTVASSVIIYEGVGAVQTWKGDGTENVSYPSATQPGDLLLLVVAHSHEETKACPSGWTQRESFSTNNGSHASLVLCYKFAVSGESGSSTVAVTEMGASSMGYSAEIVDFRNVNQTTPFDVSDVTTTSVAGASTFSPTGLTTVTANAMAVSLVMQNDSTSTQPTLSLGTANGFGFEFSNGVQTSASNAEAEAHESIGTAGAVTFPTWASTQNSNANEVWLGISFALRPVSPTAPTITSGNSTTFSTNTSGSFTVTTSGYPTPSIVDASEGSCTASTLPGTVAFTDNSDGTATLSGNPGAATGSYTLCLTASNGVNPAATQTLTLTVSSFSISGVMFSNIVMSGGGAAQTCTTQTITASIACTAMPLGPNGTFTANVEMVNASGTPLTNTSGIAITVNCLETTIKIPVSTVSPASSTIANGNLNSTSTFTLTGGGGGWKATMTCSVVVNSTTYQIAVTGN